MWILTLIDALTGFIPRPVLMRPDEGGFRQVPKPWSGWPWTYWPWVRWSWIKRPWKMWPWAPKDDSKSTWLTEMKPGEWYWLIPWIMEHEIVRTKTQVVDVRIQSAWTKDGVDVAIGGAIRYYVKNPMKALLEVHNYDQSLQNVSLGVILEFVRQHELKELKSDMEDLTKNLLEVVRTESKGWGLWIQNVVITDVGRTRNIRLLTNSDVLQGIE